MEVIYCQKSVLSSWHCWNEQFLAQDLQWQSTNVVMFTCMIAAWQLLTMVSHVICLWSVESSDMSHVLLGKHLEIETMALAAYRAVSVVSVWLYQATPHSSDIGFH